MKSSLLIAIAAASLLMEVNAKPLIAASGSAAQTQKQVTSMSQKGHKKVAPDKFYPEKDDKFSISERNNATNAAGKPTLLNGLAGRCGMRRHTQKGVLLFVVLRSRSTPIFSPK